MKQITYSFPEDGSPYVKSLLEVVEGIISAHNKGKGEVTLKDIEGYLKCHLCMCNLILENVEISLTDDHILSIDENLKCVMEIKTEPEKFKDNYTNKEKIIFAINFAQHCLNQVGFGHLNPVGEMVHFENKQIEQNLQ